MMNLSATIIIAIYGAVLSTITAAIQLSSHFRDRAKIRLKMRKNMATVGMGRGYAGMTMVIITATNVGRRPVTIAGFAAELLYGKQEYDAWYLQDVKPPLPCEITEGHEVSAFVNQKNVSFDVIASWYAWDTTGRETI